MQKLRFTRLIMFSILLIIVGLIAYSCGGPAKDKAKGEAALDAPGKNDDAAKHRAFDHFTKGDLYERSNDLEKAADEYRLALYYDPDSDELKRSLSHTLYDLSRFDEALEVAIKISEENIDDKMLIAGCYNNVGKLDKAVEYFENIAQADSAPQEVYENLAGYFAYKKDQAKVEKYYSWLIKNSDNNKYWRAELATAYLGMDKPKQAEKIYREILKVDSLDYGAYLGLASVMIYNGKIGQADSLYRYVANLNWEDAPILSMLLPALVDLEDTEMSIKVARRIVELYPQDYLASRRLGILLYTSDSLSQADSVFTSIITGVEDDPISYYYRGRIAQQNEQYPQAEKFYHQAIVYADTLPEAWVNLALLRGLGDSQTDELKRQAVLATFDSALVHCPKDSTQVLFFTGAYLSREELYMQAIGYYERVLLANPDWDEVKFNLAAAYERTAQYDKAEARFKELLESNPDNAMALNYLGYMYADRGIKFNEADKLIKKALKINPNNGAYLDSYAWLLYKQGKYKDALKYQLQALQSEQSEDAVLYDHMGDIYFALNKTQQAENHWEKALELDPNNDTIKQKLQK